MRNGVIKTFVISTFFALSTFVQADNAPIVKPNITLFFADDISTREMPIYGSSVWTPPEGRNTTDPQFRAQSPVDFNPFNDKRIDSDKSVVWTQFGTRGLDNNFYIYGYPTGPTIASQEPHMENTYRSTNLIQSGTEKK